MERTARGRWAITSLDNVGSMVGMGALSAEQGHFVLRHHTLIGRGRAADLVLDHPHVSGEHAVIYFAAGSWIVKDLGSRNGTFLNKRRLEPQQREALRAGDTLCLGSLATSVRLEDESPPAAFAKRTDGGPALQGEPDLLALPSGSGSTYVLLEDGAWWLEHQGQRSPASDRQVLTLDGISWELCLPPEDGGRHDQTLSVAELAEMETVSLSFAVTADEEHVEITLTAPSGTRRLPSRASSYLLLELARARLRDQLSAELTESQHGWVYADDLARSLGMDPSHFNVDIFRARRLLDGIQIRNPADLIERRTSTRQLRLGTGRLSITRL